MRYAPDEQFPSLPTHLWSLQVRYHVSWVRLHRTTALVLDIYCTEESFGAVMIEQPTAASRKERNHVVGKKYQRLANVKGIRYQVDDKGRFGGLSMKMTTHGGERSPLANNEPWNLRRNVPATLSMLRFGMVISTLWLVDVYTQLSLLLGWHESIVFFDPPSFMTAIS